MYTPGACMLLQWCMYALACSCQNTGIDIRNYATLYRSSCKKAAYAHAYATYYAAAACVPSVPGRGFARKCHSRSSFNKVIPHSVRAAAAQAWLTACCGGAAVDPATTAAPCADCKKAGLDCNPSISNIFMSSLRSLLGVVSSLSPSKMLLAPAMKQRACTHANHHRQVSSNC